jgi:glycerophosphoryl diester phosphodiesterase
MKRISVYFIFLVSLFTVSCTTIGKEEIDNLNEGEIMVIGHAGLGFPSVVFPFNPYPPNGFAALQKAMEYGADGLEIDVQMTKDSVLVLYHDNTLESNSSLEGCIRNMTWAELENTPYQLGHFYDMFHEDEIIRLDSLLKWAATLPVYPNLQFDMRVYTECNAEDPNKGFDVFAEVFVNELNRFQVPKEKVRIISKNKAFLLDLINEGSVYPLSCEITGRLDESVDWVLEVGIPSVTIKPKLLTKEIVRALHDKGLEVITFGSKSYSGNVKLVELNPDIIQTNNVEALEQILRK